MSSGGPAPAPPRLPLQRLLSKEALIVAIALAAAVALAWSLLLTSGMAAMGVEPWSAAYLLPTFTMWALMMVAMMLPSAAPMILLHARLDRAPAARQRLVHSLMFAGAYLLVWAGFSVLAALAQAMLVDAGLLSAMSLAVGEGVLAAALLAAAGLYQLSGVKAACLDQCRSPVHFVMRFWSPGAAGALRLGLVHGLYCLGCCWALMLLLFVGGVMNLAWVAALALLVALEKAAPPGWRVSRWIAPALFAAAALLLIAQLY